jgi:ribose transport system substrate-binding protein
MSHPTVLAAALAAGAAFGAKADPQVVSGPGALPQCFAPAAADTKYFQWPAKEPPYRIALANGFVGNTWRIQMVQMLKAYSE